MIFELPFGCLKCLVEQQLKNGAGIAFVKMTMSGKRANTIGFPSQAVLTHGAQFP